MKKEELTLIEKTTLVGVMDRKNRDSIDQEFYDELASIKPIAPHEMDDGKRRAMGRYMNIALEHLKKELPPTNPMIEGAILSSLATTFIDAYELGRKLQTPLTPE